MSVAKASLSHSVRQKLLRWAAGGLVVLALSWQVTQQGVRSSWSPPDESKARSPQEHSRGSPVQRRRLLANNDTTQQDTEYGRLVDRWHSEACQDYYSGSRACRKQQSNPAFQVPIGRDQSTRQYFLNRTCVLEDNAATGRDKAVTHHGPNTGDSKRPWRAIANEVLVSHDFKWVYMGIRKGGSTSVFADLGVPFKVSHKTSCAGAPKSAFRSRKRCTSLLFTNHSALKDYFFFSFVRDPVDRWYSGVKQSLKNGLSGTRQITKNIENCSTINRLLRTKLQKVRRTGKMPDSHWETQSLSLSTTVIEDGIQGMRRVDWLEWTDRMPEAMPHLLSRIEENAGKAIPATIRAAVLERTSGAKRTSTAAKDPHFGISLCRTAEMEALVREVYAQDTVCFGST